MPAGACRGSSSTTRWVTDGASTRGLEQEPAGSGPFDGAFRLFLMGFVAVSVGGLTWGLVLRRLPHLRLAGYGLLAVAVLGFLAITVGDNIVHDVTLLSSYAAWVLVGLGADRGLGQAGARAGAPASSHNAAHGRRAADAR